MKRIVATAIAASAGLCAAPLHAEGSLTYVSWGGNYQQAERDAFLDPIEDELGITIREETYTGVHEVRAQVLSGAVTWDIVDLGGFECAQGQAEGLFEELDWNVVSTEGLDDNAWSDTWVSILYYSTVLAYNPEALEKAPTNFTDFWDVENFPGRRALYNEAPTMLEAALLADGVPKDELYPLDLDRAFAKLEEIKPHIDAWWDSGAQSIQLLADGEVDMLPIWNGRIEVLKEEGFPVEIAWDQGTLSVSCVAIPKGAPNKDLAMKAINLMISPEIQANLPQYINYGPANALAFDTGKIAEDKVATSPSAPEHLKVQAVISPSYWGERLTELDERWDAFMLK